MAETTAAPIHAGRPFLHEPRRSTTFVLVGGVPGAGKTTLLRWVAPYAADAHLLDPERYRHWLSERLPAGLPYRWYRGAVHALHALAILTLLLLGPRLVRRDLVVAEPATRSGRRELLARLARARGWEPALLLLDVPCEVALAGQRARGRVLGAQAFARHWTRWTAQRPGLARAGRAGGPYGSWCRVSVVDRSSAPGALLSVLGRRPARLAG